MAKAKRAEKTTLKIETWPIGKVLTYAKNARLHSDEQVDLVSKSIAEFGFVNPCLVDADGVLIAGHCRVLSAKKLGMKTVPVIRLGHLSEQQARALRIADNQLPMRATWDAELLRLEVSDLTLLGFDMPLLGFDTFQLNGIMTPPNAGESDPEIVPERPKKPIVRTGDLWLLGEHHRLLCGDATNADDVAKVLGDDKPNLMVTDPPYGVDYDPDWRNRADRANGKPYGARAIGIVSNDDRGDWSAAWK